MPRFLIVPILLAATAGVATAAASQDVALRDEAHINSTLLSAAIGAMIAHECDGIEPRKVFAAIKAWQLNNYALRQGYTEDEIDAFLHDKAEERRKHDDALEYLTAEHGVRAGDAASYCAAGMAEIERGSLAGRLIRAK